MKNSLILVLGLMLLAVLFGCPKPQPPVETTAMTPPPASKDNQTRLGTSAEEKSACPHCGMNALASDGMVKASAGDFDSLACWILYSAEKKLDPMSAEVLDYATKDGAKAYVKIADAFYVPVDSLKGAMTPCFTAFAKKDDAEKYSTKEDSYVASFGQAVEMIKKDGGKSMMNSAPEKPKDDKTADGMSGMNHGDMGGMDMGGAHAGAPSAGVPDGTRKVANAKCPMCSMKTATSPTMLKYVDDKGKETDFVSLECWIDYANQHKLAHDKADILDYDSIGKVESYVHVANAYFVPAKFIKFSMPPYIAAFTTKPPAEAFAKDKGTSVIAFSDAEAKVAAFIKEEEKHGGEHH